VPLYRQLYEHIALRIRSGELARGERLPATRELAGLLGLNRTTVSAAYDALETDGLIAGQVGRGSFVTAGAEPSAGGVDWSALLDRGDAAPPPALPLRHEIASFVMSRPSRELFPLDDFRASCQAVLARPDLADSATRFAQRVRTAAAHLLDEARRQSLGRTRRRPAHHQRLPAGARPDRPRAAPPGDTVAVEDPVYPGLKNLLTGWARN
jgi:DNA-binding transcriptional MocR family regulator